MSGRQAPYTRSSNSPSPISASCAVALVGKSVPTQWSSFEACRCMKILVISPIARWLSIIFAGGTLLRAFVFALPMIAMSPS